MSTQVAVYLTMATNENLKKLLNEIAEKHGHSGGQIEIQPVSSEGANYSSQLFVVNILSPTKEDLKLFAKLARCEPDFHNVNNPVSTFFKLERMFYTELSSNFQRIYDKHNVPEEYHLKLPKYYGHIATDLEEILVLDNLKAKGFTNFDRMKTMDWEYASKAVEQLAKFHAIGLAYREEDPKSFEKSMEPTGVHLWTEPALQEAFFKQAYKVGTEYINEEYRERVKAFLENPDLLGLLARNNEVKSMLIHADYRPSNLMHRRKNGKIELVPLDFQTYRQGSPAADLVHLICSASDEGFRKFHFQQLLDFYYSQLDLELKRLNLDVEEIYPKKVYDQHIQNFLPFGLLTTLALMSLVTVDPEDAPNLNEDPMSMFTVVPNEKALERIHGILRDCMRWGVL